MTDNQDLLNSTSVQNFIKTVYSLQQSMERVSTNALAEALNISPPSVTDMAQRLEEANLLDYQKYKGVVLTLAGEQLALKIVRRHRLIELYLVEELGYDLSEVHDEAEDLEHAVSDRFIEALSHKLDHPSIDPHGDPIPTADGAIPARDLHPLTDWPLHTRAQVSRIVATSPEMLQHILDRDFRLDAQVEVLARDPFDGPVTVRVDGGQQVIGHHVAACILVEAPEAPPE
jgi:DtxR family Mn-dependent transcriptional regulator